MRIRAFTLIELLVVISIIGILAAMITFSFTSSQRQARDANRKSDLGQYRSALEAYANKNNGLYPTYTTRTDPSSDAFCTLLGQGTTCPDDPKNNSEDEYFYSYISNGVGASPSATDYVLWVKLEGIQTTTYWVTCSNGKSGQATSAPTSATCPI